MNKKKNIQLWFLAVLLLISGFTFGTAAAEDIAESAGDSAAAFAEWIGTLEEQEIIPKTSGTFISLGDYEDSLAQLGYVRKIPLLESDNFAASIHLSWESGSKTPDIQIAGCGVIFNSAEDTPNHMMASVRMDGLAYISGSRYYSNLTYGKNYYGSYSINGSADLKVVVSDNTVHVYVNDTYLPAVTGYPYVGNEIGLGILSGTYSDFGTRCRFEDIRFYVWEND